ncbi:regulator of chromosome condensation, putative [Ichthyophthirius multifiliis]|uniref:Regulator of chromosome condensation, putative n=1 Tax=Ichthyophthirius multifiliis TaxID=5932 RepID=G0QRD5_ICHMU|nr:regulator of chromosome condensation, putative [Ichthyophthirius multifiliis]EGR32219.1 regulator of chromosome condensation, putative [Ichthyophthirius multifiliis]|eukprot:XP_004035705.1 regulator of chromosome condensation, putative [Ichthyophthirius multifiliis]
MGRHHTAVITTNGKLFTFGCGKHGALGYKNYYFQHTPKEVPFFSDRKLKVIDVVTGYNHTIAVVENGDIYSWGWSGNNLRSIFGLNYLMSLFKAPPIGALGRGITNNNYLPEKISNLNAKSYQQLVSGDHFVHLVKQGGELVNWGQGIDGCLGNGYESALYTPAINEYFQNLKDEQHINIVKIKAAAHHSVVLLSDGNLYSFGKNDQGQLGIRLNLGHTNDKLAVSPTPVNNVAYKGQNIVDFDTGKNTLVILTDQNQVFFSGLELAYQPIKWEIPSNEKIIKVTASEDSFAALTENGTLYQFNQYCDANVREYEQYEYAIQNDKSFQGKIVDVGGNYGIRYAIVN